jgi:Ion channel
MYSNWLTNLVVVAATAATVAVAVLVHYEGLRLLSGWLVRSHGVRRRKVLLGVYGVVLLHVIEIWLFGAAIWVLLTAPEAGMLSGLTHTPLLDSVYMSAATFTTVGFGDLAPVGPIRFLSGTEALTGFILITWSASFLYLEMQQYWSRKTG